MARFDAFSELFDRYADIIDHRYRPWLEQVLPQQAGRALDAGCGAGRYTTLLADRCQHVLSIDVAERLLTIARHRHPHPNVTFQQRDLRDLSVAADGRFDVVLAVAVVHHLPDPEQAVRHLASLVAPGGRLLIIDMVRPSQRWTRPRIVRYAVAEATHELARRRSLPDAATVLRLRLHSRRRSSPSCTPASACTGRPPTSQATQAGRPPARPARPPPSRPPAL